MSISERDSVRTWFISDTHFDHTNIIKYCGRPFETVTEMNRVIWSNWNKCIRPDDLVIFGGDMAYGRGSRKPRWWLEQLNGRKIYLTGSHDKGIRPHPSVYHELDGRLLFVAEAAIVRAMGESIFVVHEPGDVPHDWPGWVIHGHVHNNKPHADIVRKRFNMCVEVMDYKPRNLYYFLELMGIFDE